MIMRVMMLMVLLFVNNANAFFLDKQKTFIFVSFSMSDEALKSYFADSQKAGAQLVMRGLIITHLHKQRIKLWSLVLASI
ncbi:type-F conjugative transfer system pilin assembly family protein [Orientia tsutsugamushi str. UT76]|uniref:Type-F conjugative transfer system pilin assembly protein TrbC n=1 Tax=Orientia tsutsugamushi TaxID=784 RepID=A0A2U3QNH6_ORITS|nr:type-F conjugative transfer system pilin assembly family protein [Orientia tsutsugamushi str. UT76]SPR02522.1 type-F conjugative transfer system pilin assembly protein TrbC [Orientia tsutsugamushi]